MTHKAVCFCKYRNVILPTQTGLSFIRCLLPCVLQKGITDSLLDLFCPSKENFINLLFNSLIKGRSFENLSYLSSCLLSQRWKFQRISSNALRGIELDIACIKVSGVVSHCILLTVNLWDPLNNDMLRNKQNVSLVISKLA